MVQPNETKLFGSVRSGYCDMIHHALRLKGVKYDYEEEDLTNKSEEFLKMNPVYKKVPTLVVDGKPIAESLVILQYIDETWPQPPLMPQDPYLKSKVRFWADFIYQKFFPTVYAAIISEGESKAKAIDEFLNKFKTLEDGISKEVYTEGLFIHGTTPGLLDLIMGGCYPRLKPIETFGVKFLNGTNLCAWMDEYVKIDVVRETAEMLSQYSPA
ncbi:hypothetical protein LUZ60_003099 [Juncus effusus]|nr:hypothetical protein LUZ60_003099 [Juncus effusus]